MQMTRAFQLSVTTQGPTYPPSEVMDAQGNFVVIGRVNKPSGTGRVSSEWGAALVRQASEVPPFGEQRPYDILRELDLSPRSKDLDIVLHTLPLPLPNNNYPIVFGPEQLPNPDKVRRASYPFHAVPVPDLRFEDGPRNMEPVTLGQWIAARGVVTVTLSSNRHYANFAFEFSDLIPNTLYTVMSLREKDLDPTGPTRPGPLGIPNVFITDNLGGGKFWATLPNPFPGTTTTNRNRVVNVILLWMSSRMSHGGAIGLHGLGGDVHAQLKLTQPGFYEFETVAFDG